VQYSESVQSIIDEVTRISGNRVQVVEDPALPHLARITRAGLNGDLPVHVLRVNPTLGDPGYLIAYECGFLLRQLALPKEDRRDFAGTAEGRNAVLQMVKRGGTTASLPEQVQQQFAA
jgi:hypothetical protein